MDSAKKNKTGGHIIIKRAIILMVFMLISLPSFAAEDNADDSQEETPIFTYGAEADFNSFYIYRGIAFSEGPVLEPSARVSAFDFTILVWGNFVLDDEPEQGEFNEADLYVYYTGEWKKITIEPTVQFYFYPDQGMENSPTTAEVSLRLSYPIGPFNVFTDQIFDFIEYEGSYFGDAGLFYEYEFTSGMLLETSASLGWASSKFNEVNIGLSKSALNVAEAGMAITYYLNEFLYIRTHVEFSTILDGDLRDELEDPTIANVGVAIGVEF